MEFNHQVKAGLDKLFREYGEMEIYPILISSYTTYIVSGESPDISYSMAVEENL